jgi:protease I
MRFTMQLPESRIALLVSDGYKELSFWYPLLRFREEGAQVVVLAPSADREYRGELGYPVVAEQTLGDARIADYDAVILPDGANNEQAFGFIRDALQARLVVGATAEVASTLLAGAAASPPQSSDRCIVTTSNADDLPAYFLAITAALGVVRA